MRFLQIDKHLIVFWLKFLIIFGGEVDLVLRIYFMGFRGESDCIRLGSLALL